MDHPPLSIMVVEDQALLAMELQYLIEDAGHAVVGWASNLDEADAILRSGTITPDLAFVDIHLSDGPTGTVVAEQLRERSVMVVYMTANAKRIPQDFGGAVGVIAKPYTSNGVLAALDYLHRGVRDPPPSAELPPGLRLSPDFVQRWTLS